MKQYPANGAPYPDTRNVLKREVVKPRSFLLETIAIAVALSSLSYAAGCTVDRVLTVTSDPEHALQVEEAVGTWNDALGCDALEVGEDGLPIRFYNEDDWPGTDTERGLYTSSGIAIRRTVYQVERGTLVHELGHALGAGHSPNRPDVMWYIVSDRYLPTEYDIALVDATLRECH